MSFTTRVSNYYIKKHNKFNKMKMNVQLNNKTYTGKLLKRGCLKIKLSENSDILFFKEWLKKTYGGLSGRHGYKRDYTKTVQYTTIMEQGILTNCFPLLSLNDDYVVLHWDVRKPIIQDEKKC